MRVVVALAAGLVAGQQASAQVSGQPIDGAEAASRDVIIVTGVGPARTSDELIASTSVLFAKNSDRPDEVRMLLD